MATRPIQFGIMGCADIASTLCQAISRVPAAAAVCAVASRSADKARRFIADNGLPGSTRAHGSYDSLLEDAEVEAVYVPLPTSLHVRWGAAAAQKGKHVLLEKPAALCAAELDRILEACEAAGVQFMDGTMWMHHPRTDKMWEIISDPNRFGHFRLMNSTVCFHADSNFLENNIRTKRELDSLGALGDAGWYCIRAILWANNYKLPHTAISFPNPIKNEAGVILSCGASLHWNNGTSATFHCSFLAHMTFEITIIGTKGSLHSTDFVIPFDKPAKFTFSSGFEQKRCSEEGMMWRPASNQFDVVDGELTQEGYMVAEFSRLVRDITDGGAEPEKKWSVICRKTQVVLDAVMNSIEHDFKPVEIVY